MVKIHKHLSLMQPSDTLVINEYSKNLQSQGREVYKFGFGQSPFPVPQSIQESLRSNAHQKDYLPVQGLEELRAVVASHMNRLLEISMYDSDDILIGPGSKQLIFLMLLIHDGPLILPSPSWVSYAPQATIIKKPTYWVPCNKSTWLLEPEALETAVVRNNLEGGILILNYPNNPTGQSYTQAQFIAIAEVCRKYRVIVIADEIYGLLNFEDNYQSIAAYYPEGTMITSGISKWCGAGGWRLGIMTIPENLKSFYQMMKVISSETHSAVAAPIQYAAVQAYLDNPEILEYINRSRTILNRVNHFVHSELSGTGIRVNKASGGFYLFPEFESDRFNDSSDLCKRVLRDCGVALLPGTSFGRPRAELTARLAFVDFDGSAALQYLEEYDDVDQHAFGALFPKIVQGVAKLKSWATQHQIVQQVHS